MRPPAGLGRQLVLVFLALFGWGAVWIIFTSRDAVPLSDGWFGVFVSLPLGALVGGYSATAFVRLLLHALVPSRLEGDSRVLHVRIFVTWKGLFAGFRKSNARMKGDDIVGISFGTDQGGHCQLFLAHRSGYDCYAGFTGERVQAERYGREILSWLNAQSQTREHA